MPDVIISANLLINKKVLIDWSYHNSINCRRKTYTKLLDKRKMLQLVHSLITRSSYSSQVFLLPIGGWITFPFFSTQPTGKMKGESAFVQKSKHSEYSSKWRRKRNPRISATVRTQYNDGWRGSIPSSFIPTLNPIFTTGNGWNAKYTIHYATVLQQFSGRQSLELKRPLICNHNNTQPTRHIKYIHNFKIKSFISQDTVGSKLMKQRKKARALRSSHHDKHHTHTCRYVCLLGTFSRLLLEPPNML